MKTSKSCSKAMRPTIGQRRKRPRLFPILLVMLMLLTTIPHPASAADQQQESGSPTGIVADDETGQKAQIPGVTPSSLFDPDEIGWASVRGMTSSQFSAHFDKMKDDYMMIDIEVDEINGEQRVSAVWQLNPENRAWVELRGLNDREFHAKWTELKEAGYRLIDQEAYMLDDRLLYAGIWVKNLENLAWASLRNLDNTEFSDNFSKYRDAGYIIIDVEGYPTPGGLRYSMVWVKNVENLGWIEHRNMSTAEFSEKFENYKDKYRMWDVESYRHNGVQYYAGIWVENKNGRGWYELRNMTAKQYRNRWYRMRDLGYRLIDFEVYPTADGERYAGIWRQNSDRPDWPVKNDIDNLVQSYLETNDLPGIGVAIAQDGEIKYSRGFGFQDIENDIWYSSRTINRLASVSKAVGGVLAMHLVEQGVITDLDAPSSSIIPGLPAHHTHTLRQLLSNRSGIGHYEDYSVPNQAYATAQDAFQTFWNTDSDPNSPGAQLVYQPGVGCKYSTHALIGAGASMEALAGKSIGQIVADELTTPFGLTTLRQEQPNDGNGNRSVAYNDDNNPQPWPNATHKVLGGGLESSSHDLVRFLMKVMDGSIISADGLAEMQTVPGPLPCVNSEGELIAHQYALGWRVSTKYNTPVIWKGGNWNPGANTHVRIYPELDTAIVILSNRNAGHDTRSLGAQISDLMFAGQDLGEHTGYDVDGVEHNIAGGAHASYNGDDGLVISNIGASGDDGVNSTFPAGKFWGSQLQMQLKPGLSAFEAAAIAQSGQVASTLLMQAQRGGVEIRAQFDAPTYQIQYVRDGKIVHIQDSGGDGAPTASINWDLFWCVANLPHSLPSQICDVYYSFYENQQGVCEWNLNFAKPLSTVAPDGASISYDRLRLVEIEDAHAATTVPHEEMSFSAIQLRAKEMEMFSLDDVSVGGADAVPQSPQEAPNSVIFLPLVSKQ